MSIFKIKTKYRQIRFDFNLEKNPLYSSINKIEPIAVRNSIPLTWHKAINFSVIDNLNNKWIDLTSGIFVTNAGHANSFIKNAIKKQLDSNLIFSYNYPTKIKEKFLKKILEISPAYFEQVALLNTGSEAVDLAYKLIKLYGKKENKKYIISFNGSYHGRGLSNELIGGKKEKAQKWSGLSDDGVIFIDFPYGENDKFDPKKLPPGGEIAAFMLETFQGWGAWFYPNDYLRDLYRFAKKHGALICFDEMQSGFYRLGEIYGYMTYCAEIKPDLICLGKGISSSLPISAVLSRKKIFNLDEHADMHGTHSSNPICCAAGLANLEFLSKNIKKFRRAMEVFKAEVRKLSEFDIVKKINVRGMIAGVIFENTRIATAVVKDCIKNGVLPVCTNLNSIKIAPPLTISSSAIKESISVVANSIKTFSKNKL
jgi:4-aminobutyrate aminotransferase / (S)-3-amino-2-methylpropionate transaminase / 5-aminovalerate transaminase